MTSHLRQQFDRLRRRRLAFAVAVLMIIAAALWLIVGNMADRVPAPAEVAERMTAGLVDLRTVQGTLQLVNGEVATEQELWVERPRRLRTEIEAGPPILAPQGENFKTTLVLNESDAWFYNPNLNLTTVADRSDYQPEAGLDVGGSILESMAQEIIGALEASRDIQIIGEEEIAGRRALRVQLILPNADNVFKARTLNVALDRHFYYPLLIESDGGFVLRFRTVEFNKEIDPATFVFAPPPGSTVNEVAR